MSKTKVLGLVLTLCTSSAFAALMPASPQATVETIIDNAKVAGSAERKNIESLVDFAALTKGALGEHVSKTTPAQLTRIEKSLKTILTKNVYPKAPAFFKGVEIQFQSTSVNSTPGSLTKVSSVVTKDGSRSTVDYWVKSESDKYAVVDLAVNGERWVENIASQFDEIIRKNGITGLIAKLDKRAAATPSKN